MTGPALFTLPKQPRPFRADDPPRLTPLKTGRRPPQPRRARRDPPEVAQTRSLHRDHEGRYTIEPDRAVQVWWQRIITDRDSPNRGESIIATAPITVVTGYSSWRLTVNEARALHAGLTAVLAEADPP